ncbi:hypothetical protein Tco_1570683 [Tanacetum coccineum]
MTTSAVNYSVFRGFFEKQKLTGPDFIDWYRQLRIVLSVKDKLDYLEQPIPPAPVLAQAGQQVAPEALAAHAAWVKGSKEIEEGKSVGSYVLKMKSYIDNLERLGHPVSLNLGYRYQEKEQQAKETAIWLLGVTINGREKNKLAVCSQAKFHLHQMREKPAKTQTSQQCV